MTKEQIALKHYQKHEKYHIDKEIAANLRELKLFDSLSKLSGVFSGDNKRKMSEYDLLKDLMINSQAFENENLSEND